MQFFIDIENSAGTRLGSGPITSASYWQSTNRVDRIGNFSFAMPAADEKASLIASRNVATCYAILPTTGFAEVGSGVIDRIETRPGNNGDVDLVVSGDDLLSELRWRTVGLSELSTGGLKDQPKTHSASVSQLAAFAPAGWTITADPAPPNDDLFYYFRGESLFAALLKVGELSRSHIRLSGSRTLLFDSTWTDSGLRAIEAPPNADIYADNLCYIGGLTAAVDTFDLVTRIYAYGGKIPGTSPQQYVNMNFVTKSAAGYTIGNTPAVGDYLQSTAGVAAHGVVEQWINYNEITFTSASGDFLETSANQLFDMVLWELQRRAQPISYYTLSLAHSPTIIQPMTTIRCVFRRYIDGRSVVDIDEQMYVMGATTKVDAEGMRTTELEVATSDIWQPSDVEPLRKLMQDNNRLSLLI